MSAATLEAPAVPLSGVTGIHWRRGTGSWAVRAYQDGEQHWIGRYVNLDEAKAALDAWKSVHAKPPSEGPRPRLPSRITLTPDQVAYAMSIAHEIRGF